ncbi:MAG: acyltransferase [Bacteroides sp.]|nr:acyltransferase [Bacteroides sp.]
MAGKRVDYIDYLKGLSIIWVVWYHTVHPWFVDFSFRMPLFFLASGIFFKITDWKTYLQKKTNQLVVPFVFFSLIYYIYLILQNFAAYGSLSAFDFGCIFGVFEFHSGNESFIVDPPLWFICALFCQQILTWLLVKSLRRKWLIALAAIAISWVGLVYVWDKPTLFMFGRSLPYLVYYVFGNLFGKDLIRIIESNSSKVAFSPLVGSTVVYLMSIVLKINTDINVQLLTYTETFGLIIMLIYLFKGIHHFKVAYPFWFFGRNSYIVLGMHEIYQTIFMILFLHILGEINIWIGMVQTLMSLLLLWPTIKIMNRRVPMLVGKAELINLSKIYQRLVA